MNAITINAGATARAPSLTCPPVHLGRGVGSGRDHDQCEGAQELGTEATEGETCGKAVVRSRETTHTTGGGHRHGYRTRRHWMIEPPPIAP